jgi:hypothetical protein
MFDLRLPTGAFFTIISIILLAMAFFAPDAKASLTETNVNLYCGLVMLAFGVFMLYMAWRGSRNPS